MVFQGVLNVLGTLFYYGIFYENNILIDDFVNG